MKSFGVCVVACLLALVPLANCGCLDREDHPISHPKQLRKLDPKKLDEIFTHGCIEDKMMLGPAYGEVIATMLPFPFDYVYQELFGLAWEGTFMQKTHCKGEDFHFHFSLLNPLDGSKLFKSQVTWFPAKASIGKLPDKHKRLDDEKSYIYDYSVSKTDCPDEVSPWGRQKYPFDNPPPLKLIYDEARIVGVYDDKPIQLVRVFLNVYEKLLIPIWYEMYVSGEQPTDGESDE